LSAVREVFTKTKKRFYKADQMVELLVQEGLTTQEAHQALSLAEKKRKIQACYPWTDGIRGERSYMLLTKKEKEIQKELEKELLDHNDWERR
jgi:uncharacterized protein involved in tolerance to divalent cations